jgi:hypothetical protein
MTTLYRFYHIGPDGHFKRVEAIPCASDAEALAKAAALSRQRVAVEVWTAARFVGRIESPNPPKR